ncbi:MAG: hypothetical protein HOC71_10420 [Candidatus Latescibacteria bacterium]|nr:hypothetical protein [Candidatus Latescibacterota bacterium]
MDNIAESYVKLILEVGLYDSDYVDAYYGPEEWRPAEGSKQKKFPHEQLTEKVNRLIKQLEKVNPSKFQGIERLRYTSLMKELSAIRAKIDLLSGTKMSFDEESKALYDAVAPVHDDRFFENILKKLGDALPGKGDINERFNDYRNEFIIPKDKLEGVFRSAIAECRRRTLKYIELPTNEDFTLEFVTDKSWLAYNWYKGNSFSVIQINTDKTLFIDRAIGLSSHEGYPGHHTHLTLLEKHLLRDRNWVEYSVCPLFSPRVLIMEGIAGYARRVLFFPSSERVEYEQTVLFPLAGLDPSKAEKYYEIKRLTGVVGSYGRKEAARRYLDGKMSKDETPAWLRKYGLHTPKGAEAAIGSFENYRSYVITYSVGRDMLKNYIEAHGSTDENHAKRWELFTSLLTRPPTASALR